MVRPGERPLLCIPGCELNSIVQHVFLGIQIPTLAAIRNGHSAARKHTGTVCSAECKTDAWRGSIDCDAG
eukprot:2914183-Pyramimonas_sp.AAC.1